jgi:hypothetical protein
VRDDSSAREADRHDASHARSVIARIIRLFDINPINMAFLSRTDSSLSKAAKTKSPLRQDRRGL